MMIQILINHLNGVVDKLAKKHMVSKEQVRITYEFYQFYYYIDEGKESFKYELDLKKFL